MCRVKLKELPGWVVSDEDSVREEVASWVGTTEAERWVLARHCARDVLWALGMSDRAAQALDHEDPLSPSTVAALLRLRSEAGWGRR